MLGGFFCVSSTKKRKTSGNKTKKAKKSPVSKSGKKSFRKFVRGSQQGGAKGNTKKASHKNNKKGQRKQTGGETIQQDLTDGLGRGSYPVSHRGHTDCSGVHHK